MDPDEVNDWEEVQIVGCTYCNQNLPVRSLDAEAAAVAKQPGRVDQVAHLGDTVDIGEGHGSSVVQRGAA